MSKKKLGFGLMRLPLLDVNDQGSIDLAVLHIEKSAQIVFYYTEHGKALCPLPAPGSVYLARMPAPEVFGIVFKEHPVKSFAEIVDVKVFEIVLGPFVKD